MSFRFTLAIASLAISSLSPAVAALPTGKLEFVQRTGTALTDERIAVVMRLTLDPDSSPLTFSNDPLVGFDPADLPTEGSFYNSSTLEDETRPFATFTGALLNTFYSCQGDFTLGCGSGGNYNFVFNTIGTLDHPSINFRSSFTLAAGESFEYTFGFFVPTAGGAAPGVYRWNGTAVTLFFQGLDIDGNIGTTSNHMVSGTGNDLDPGVAFERLVTAVPEPSTYAMLAMGLATLAGLARRRHSLSR